MGGDGGRAEIDGEAADRAGMEARPELDQLRRLDAVVVDRAGHRPVAGAQHLLEPAQQDGGAADRRGEVPLCGEGGLQAFEIARGVVHVGLGHLDEIEPRGGIEHDLAGLDALAHHLAVDLAFGGDVDHHVALDAGLAAEAAAGGEAALVVVALLDAVPGRERVFGDGDAELGEAAVSRGDLAFRADAAAAADGVEIDAEPAGRVEDRGAFGDAAAFAGGREDDEGVLGGHGRFAFLGRGVLAHLARGAGAGKVSGVRPRGLGDRRCGQPGCRSSRGYHRLLSLTGGLLCGGEWGENRVGRGTGCKPRKRRRFPGLESGWKVAGIRLANLAGLAVRLGGNRAPGPLA